MVYGLHCYIMIAIFMLKQKKARQGITKTIESYNRNRKCNEYPFVTIQLPIYNELEVVHRLLWSAAVIDYPKDRYEVQVLDDSNDKTVDLVNNTITEIRKQDVNIYAVRRPKRIDFKAGALAYGLSQANGDYIAIFDSDFIIPKHFLKRTIALIHGHDKVGCVQARWGHYNQKENWLTRAQSVGIDGHFTAEQGARGYTNLCMNFNGTAGTWSKKAIEDGGGWQGDTLTEDLDLSYRVQMAGYAIQYDFDLECPAEVPNNVTALKSQQKRWAKGSIETAIKILPELFAHKRFSILQKIEAFLHLTHYAVSLFMSILFMLTMPMLLWTPLPEFDLILAIIWSIVIFSAIAPCVMYTLSGCILKKGFFSFSHFPAMLAVGTGLCLNNAKAVIEGIMREKSDFIRTPKSGSSNNERKQGRYKAVNNAGLGYIELLSGLYCLATLVLYFQTEKYLFGFFIAAYAFGLTVFGLLTVRSEMNG